MPRIMLLCGYDGCSKQPSYGLPGDIPSCCTSHKLGGMIHLKAKKCGHDQCGKQPSYGLPDQRTSRCAEHKLDGMINARKRMHDEQVRAETLPFC